jgi:hypothetical protein
VARRRARVFAAASSTVVNSITGARPARRHQPRAVSLAAGHWTRQVAAFAAGGQAAEFAAGGLGSFRVMDSGLLRGGDKGEAVLGLAVGQPVRAVLPVLGDAEPPLVGFRQAGHRLADAGQVQPGDQRGDPAGRPLAVSPPPSEYLMTAA